MAKKSVKITETSKIRVLVKDRVVREDSIDGRIWNAISNGMTVAQFVAKAAKVKGGKDRNARGMLAHFRRSGFVAVQ
jgi:hypothetical protein